MKGEYIPIQPVNGRLPSQVLGLHLERDGKDLRFYKPAPGRRLLTLRGAGRSRRAALVEERQLREAAEAERRRLCMRPTDSVRNSKPSAVARRPDVRRNQRPANP